MQSDLMRKKELVAIKEEMFITAGCDLDTTLSYSFWSWILFAIVEQLIELKFLVQQVELKWLILNTWIRLFHSSRLKFPLVNMSASWCLVSKRIWILGSKWILSNNQSRAAVWARETCLIVGLRLLIIILITASLSKTYNIALGSECVVFGGMWSMFVGMSLVFLIGMGLCMFGLTLADGFHRGSLFNPSVLFGTEWNTSTTKSQRESGNTVHA